MPSSLRVDALRQLTAEPTGAVERGTMERFLCEECGEAIGVYEPLVVGGGYERTTSRAAEPELRANGCPYYHRDCHAGLPRSR
jgi:hypothetical protein